ncbi:hypothetical protein LCGC14_0961380 [marine sediment metagenome]|uniref:Siphovirus-type tail component RIFT-related domain-containing protein n=1 Tax=marine sediment metagenome TaxID=412755 RepID=A0A0F9NJ17_9ZZZZ
MAKAVTFDSTSLQNVNRITKSLGHDSATDRDLEILQLARDDGGILVSEHYGSKMFQVDGIIKASSQANLETEIDTFKELLSRKAKNLDIEYAGNTRRYVAYARNVFINRDFFHVNFAPYTIEFVVPSGLGVNTASTESVDDVDISPIPYTGSASFLGSATPKPVIKFTFGSDWSNALGIKFSNTDKNEECIINRSAGFSDGDNLEIDTLNKVVRINDAEIEFYRVFPSFDIGSNAIEITAGDIVDQLFDDEDNETAIGALGTRSIASGNDYPAQSFTVPHTDDTYQGLIVRVGKGVGGSATDVDVEIQTDTNGAPSGSAVTNGTFVITASELTVPYSWMTLHSTNTFELNANTVYWIVMKVQGDAGDTECKWSTVKGVNANYGRGLASSTLDGGSTWTAQPTWDRLFKLLYGGKPDAPTGNLTLDIDYIKRYL